MTSVRTTADQIADLTQHPGAQTFAGAVDALLQAFGGGAQVGAVGPVEQETILFRAAASLGFPAADIASVSARTQGSDGGWPAEMEVTFLGLYGPSSPLPPFWTERIIQDSDGGENLRDFLDLFNHPLIALVYRVIRHYQIDRHFDRVPGRPAERMLMALAGQFGETAMANSLDWPRLLPFCGLLAQSSRSPDIVARIVAGYFDVPVTVDQWLPRAVPIPPDQLFTLGNPQAGLGTGTVLGSSVPDIAGTVGLVLGPLSREAFETFLPDGTHRAELRALLQIILREPIGCLLDLLLDPAAADGLVLGQGRLGWTTWQAGGEGPLRCPTGLI